MQQSRVSEMGWERLSRDLAAPGCAQGLLIPCRSIRSASLREPGVGDVFSEGSFCPSDSFHLISLCSLCCFGF